MIIFDDRYIHYSLIVYLCFLLILYQCLHGLYMPFIWSRSSCFMTRKLIYHWISPVVLKVEVHGQAPVRGAQVTGPVQLQPLCSAALVEITLHYITLHYITSHHITSHHITSHHITSHHITLHYITLHHITSHYITIHHITSHHITSHHITLHYIIGISNATYT